ncbi:MAG: UDP-N-acetylglucosamine 2-epimerase (hydrolyzing) [Candidatus Marinimicrobia bacterium]|nr:UDP-N-acetylglucosamine 2-epimerase (hydrolyzing) [Candidatus Neomarinimicrobiota bacterium]
MKKRKICVVTGTRAEYGLLYFLMKLIDKDLDMELQIIITGMHLSPEYGLTYKEIENDGFYINDKVEMLLSSDTPSSISKSTALGLIGFSEAFNKLNPNILVILGDRYEMLAASIAALYARIPIAHIHGGEKTSGAFDDSIRHSISKMALWHFTATKEYRNRVIQLGEDPKNVFCVGGLGVDVINKTKLYSRNKLEKKLGISFLKKNLIITYHPVTLDDQSSKKNFGFLLKSLEKLKDTFLIFTNPNSDTDGRIINKMIDDFVAKHKKQSISYKSMGRVKYLSTLQFVDAVIGNSSSGLLEAPSFKIGTINIGDRQLGRVKADSIIDCDYKESSISAAINYLYTKKFQSKLDNTFNYYGSGNTSSKIKKIIKELSIPNNTKKEFFDL